MPVWLWPLLALVLLPSSPLTSASAAAVVDVPGSIVVEPWPIPNPPVDPNRCVTVFFVEFADVPDAGVYTAVIFNQILGRNQTFSAGPPPNFPDDEYTISSGPQTRTFFAPAGSHRIVVGSNSSGSGCQTAVRFELVSITAEVTRDGRLEASMEAAPEAVAVGERFVATMTATAEDDEITNVVPASVLVLGGEGRARVLSGPEPPELAALAAGASQTFVWQLEAEAAGVVTIKGSVSGRARSGATTTAEARCTLGEVNALAAFCSLDGGAGVEVKPCRIGMTDISPPLVAYRIDPKGDSDPPPDAGYPPGGT